MCQSFVKTSYESCDHTATRKKVQLFCSCAERDSRHRDYHKKTGSREQTAPRQLWFLLGVQQPKGRSTRKGPANKPTTSMPPPPPHTHTTPFHASVPAHPRPRPRRTPATHKLDLQTLSCRMAVWLKPYCKNIANTRTHPHPHPTLPTRANTHGHGALPRFSVPRRCRRGHRHAGLPPAERRRARAGDPAAADRRAVRPGGRGRRHGRAVDSWPTGRGQL